MQSEAAPAGRQAKKKKKGPKWKMVLLETPPTKKKTHKKLNNHPHPDAQDVRNKKKSQCTLSVLIIQAFLNLPAQY